MATSAPAAETAYEPADDAAVVGHDTSGPTTDDAMTRSEERINVGRCRCCRDTFRGAGGHPELSKRVVTEERTVIETTYEACATRGTTTLHSPHCGGVLGIPALAAGRYETDLSLSGLPAGTSPPPAVAVTLLGP